MISNLYGKQLFSKLFTLGLLVLFVGAFEDQLISMGKTNPFFFDSIIYFSIGATLCLISFLFLLTEWVILPFGTQTKRIKLYQGIGNVIAFAMIGGGWLLKEETTQNLTSSLSFSLSSSGLLIAIIFGSLGNTIANYISRKRIHLESARESILLSKNRNSGKLADRKTDGTIIPGSRMPAVQS